LYLYYTLKSQNLCYNNNSRIIAQVVTVIYEKDKTWVVSKKIASNSGNKDDWTEVMTYYNLFNGSHIKLLVVDKNQIPFNFIANRDDGKSVLLGKSGIILRDSQDVYTYKKFFYYSEKEEKIADYLSDFPIKGKDRVSYVV